MPYHHELPASEVDAGRIGIHDGFLWKATRDVVFRFAFRARYEPNDVWRADCIASDFGDDLKLARDRAIEAFDAWRREENLAFGTAPRCPNCGIAARKNGCERATCRLALVTALLPAGQGPLVLVRCALDERLDPKCVPGEPASPKARCGGSADSRGPMWAVAIEPGRALARVPDDGPTQAVASASSYDSFFDPGITTE